jgi:hypothetical protein
MKESFVMVNLALMKELNISFVEAGLLERIRYFSEYDQNGSGWCYVGKLRLAEEFGMSKVGLLKAIQRLIERNLLIKNEQGWLMVNQEGLTKFTGQLSLPVNKVNERSKLSLPNNILKEDIHSINNSSIILLSKQSLPQEEQSLPVNKVSPKRKKKNFLSEEEFLAKMKEDGKEQVKLGNELVYLRRQDYDKLLKEFGKVMLHEMIIQLDLYKAQNDRYCGKELYVRDESVLRKSWVMKNAREALSVKNSPVIADIRKREKVAEEIKSQTIFFNPPPPQLTNEQ